MSSRLEVGGVAGEATAYVATVPDAFGMYHAYLEIDCPPVGRMYSAEGFFPTIDEAADRARDFLHEYVQNSVEDWP